MNFSHRHFLVALLILLPLQGLCAAPAECVRGTPSPVFAEDHPELLVRRFSPKSDQEAIERVQLKTGEVIRIRHWGCEYFGQTFTLESASLLKAGVAPAIAFKEATLFLRKLEKLGPGPVFDFGLAAKTLEQISEQASGGEFGAAYPVEGDGTEFLQTQLRVDSAKRRGRVGVLEVSLFKGPL